MRTYVQDLQELNITSADFDKALSALYDKTETEMLAISTAIRNDLDVHPVIIRGFERVLYMRHTERSQAYEYHFKQRDDVSNVIMLGFFKWESGSLNDKAIRNEYKAIEDENIRQAQIEQEQQAEDRFNEFAQSVEDQINAFTEFGGYDLNLDQQDMQDLYDFITGTDAAGNNYFAKALSDPKILVQTAWFALNGKQMIDDITDYFQKEITQVRQQSYNKGLEDAKVKNKPNVVYKEKGKTFEEYNDLDDF